MESLVLQRQTTRFVTVSYPSTVLVDTPRHFWRFADPGGQLAHDVGSLPKVLTGGFGSTTLAYSGIALDGGSAYLNNNQSFSFLATLAGVTPITVEAWVWPHWNDGTTQVIYGWDGNTGGVQLDWSGTSHFQWTVSGIATVVSSAVHNDQSWYHVVGVYDEVSMRLYVNGILEGTFVSALHKTWVLKQTVGSTSGATQFAKMNVCEVAIYDHSLSAARVTAHTLAQELNTTPVIKTGGTFPLANGGVSFNSDVATAILNSVRTSFPTT